LVIQRIENIKVIVSILRKSACHTFGGVTARASRLAKGLLGDELKDSNNDSNTRFHFQVIFKRFVEDQEKKQEPLQQRVAPMIL